MGRPNPLPPRARLRCKGFFTFVKQLEGLTAVRALPLSETKKKRVRPPRVPDRRTAAVRALCPSAKDNDVEGGYFVVDKIRVAPVGPVPVARGRSTAAGPVPPLEVQGRHGIGARPPCRCKTIPPQQRGRPAVGSKDSTASGPDPLPQPSQVDASAQMFLGYLFVDKVR